MRWTCLILLAGALPGCGDGNGGKGSIGPETNSPPKQKQEPPLSADAPVIKLTAREFYEAYNPKDPEKIEKFKGAWLEVTGKVYDIATVQADFTRELKLGIMFQTQKEGENDKHSTDLFWAYMKPGQKTWEQATAGSGLTLRGCLTEDSADWGWLDHCELISTSGPPVPRLTASELAKEYRADPKAMIEKYHGKMIVITGKVRALYDRYKTNSEETPAVDMYTIVTEIEGADGVNLGIHCLHDQAPFIEATAGDEIMIIGKGVVIPEDSSLLDEDDFFLGLESASRIDQWK